MNTLQASRIFYPEELWDFTLDLINSFSDKKEMCLY